MMKDLRSLLLLLLTVSQVTSRHVSRGEHTMSRLATSGKKSKGKKGSVKDDKHSGKKGGKKGKKGEDDDSWEGGKKTNAQPCVALCSLR